MTLREVDDTRRPERCGVHAAGTIALYFYDELAPAEREVVVSHLPRCRECRGALDELTVIRDALLSRPVVAGPVAGDWSGFMRRLDDAVSREAVAAPAPVARPILRRRRTYAGYVAMAALITLVTMSVLFVARSRGVPTSQPSSGMAQTVPALLAASDLAPEAAFAALSEEHFERSKLVVLGLTTKDAARSSMADWTYEREMASSLLSDTRIYRIAAQDHGMKAVADVMQDLEMVLLQTSLTDTADQAALGQIQRLIQRRDLLEKMHVVTITGL